MTSGSESKFPSKVYNFSQLPISRFDLMTNILSVGQIVNEKIYDLFVISQFLVIQISRINLFSKEATCA